MQRWVVQAAALLLAACGRPIDTTIPYSVSLQSDDVWSGTELRIRSVAFSVATAAAPVVMLDADPLVPQRIDDSSFVVPLPDRPGSHTLRITARELIPFQGTVRLRGFLSSEIGPVFSGRTEPTAERAEVFGNGPEGLRQWNVSTGVIVDYPDSMHASGVTRGVGPGLINGHVALYSRVADATPSLQWRLWRITGPKQTVIDTIPSEVISDRFVAVLAFGRYAVPGPHQFELKACGAGVCASHSVEGESGFDIVRSRRGDRAALVAHVLSDLGAPVVDIVAGTVAYFVPPFRSVGGAAFTDEGDTLFIGGQDHVATMGGASLLAVIRASDGVTLKTLALDYAPCAVSLESTRSWLYVAGVRRDEGGTYSSVLGVFDRRTVTNVTTLRAGSGLPFGQNLCRLLPSPLEHRLYVIDTFNGPFDERIHASLARFDTP